MTSDTVKTHLLTDSFVYYPIGVILYDREGYLLDINKAVYDKFGIKDKSEFIITHLFETELLSDLQKEHLRRGCVVNESSVVVFSILPALDRDGLVSGYRMLLTESAIRDITSLYDHMIREQNDLSEKVNESIPDTILLVNDEMVVERIIAYASDTYITPDVINRRVDDLPGVEFSDEIKQQMTNTARECLEKDKVVFLNLSLPGKIRPVIHLRIRVAPLEKQHMVVYIRNVTELIEKEKENRKLSERLIQSRMMMELALQHSKIATYSIDLRLLDRCDKIHCNRCIQFHGSTNELLLKNKYICRSLTLLRHPEDRHDFFSLFNEIRDRKLKEGKLNFRLKTDDGVFRSYEVTGKVQECEKDGSPCLIIGSIIDYQDRLEYEASLIEAKEKAESADQLKSTFLANMTHEIRSPLQAIVGFSDLLSEETDSQLREEYMNLIKSNNDLLVCLINDILDISKIEADMMTFSYMNVNLPLLMKDIYSTMLLRIQEGVTLTLDPCIDIVFNTDKSRLSQILINLLTNAIKHTSQGSIRFGYQVTGNWIDFYVSDTGVGIPKDRLENIFSRFVQLKGAKQGIGLGLAICKGLVMKMGGSITADSEEGVGSTFSFRLPIIHEE